VNVLNNYDFLKEHEERVGYELDKCLKAETVVDFD